MGPSLTRRRATAVVFSCLLGLLGSPLLADAPKSVKSRGFVDGSAFIDMAGDDAVSLEVSLSGSLLRAITRIDPDLHQLAGGLESIHAVILDMSKKDMADQASRLIRRTEKNLLDEGWERVATVREEGTRIKVLVLNDEETIQGLVVMIIEAEEHQLVFANVAGTLDLAELQRIGEGLNIPGLSDIEVP